MFKVKYTNNNLCVGIVNVPQEILDKVSSQLFPYIIKVENTPNYYIKAERSDFNDHQTFENNLYIKYMEINYLLKTLRKSIRDILYYDVLDKGYNKIHSSAVKCDNNTFMFIGSKMSGKTSTALGLCKFLNYDFIDGDLVLVKNNHLIGWPTSIGTREKTSKIIGINNEKINFNDEKTMTWLWPNELMKYGISFALEGEVSKIIIPKYDFNSSHNSFKIIKGNEKINTILDNIHYAEINKDDYWNKNKTTIEEIVDRIKSKDGIMDIETIEYTSNGLSEHNIKELHKILKG